MAKAAPSAIEQYWHKSGTCGLMTRAALRTFQFVFAVVVAGLYGADLANATKSNSHARAEWVYAEFVAAVSALTCIVHCFVTVIHVAWSAWDAVLFILWLAQVGVFGSAYVSNVQTEDEKVTRSIPRMRAAVWIDLINMLLWFATFVLGIAWCIRTRKVTRRTDQVEGDKNQLIQRVSHEGGGWRSAEQKDLESFAATAGKIAGKNHEKREKSSDKESQTGSTNKKREVDRDFAS
ncbi:hypothetical protein BBP40_007402 [Aspergillus hancockii]|nr:hypothetical protein BBP40_007402 [Aspergillus hancockii]